MDKSSKLILQFEILWWVLTGAIIYIIYLPIYRVMNEWPFWAWNAGFIVALMTFIRHIFLLEYTFIGKIQVAKVAFILALFPISFVLINGLNAFMSYIEEHEWMPLTGHLPISDRPGIESFIWTQMLFFGAGSIVSVPILAVRLFISIWKQHNRPKKQPLAQPNIPSIP